MGNKLTIPQYTHGEEIFNMVSHIVGGAFGIAATVLCVIMAAFHNNVYGVISGAIFGSSMIVLYTMSSVYHGLYPYLAAKKVLRVLDHCSIYVLIAGTYTPIALCSLREINPVLGWVYFGVVWGLSVVGILLKALALEKFKKAGLALNLAIGWCIILVFPLLLKKWGFGGTGLLLGGGILYSVGVIFYVKGKAKAYMHSVFHLFIVLGSVCHILCILFYIM